MGLTGLMKGSVGLSSSLEMIGENLLPCLYQFLEAAHFSWLMALFLYHQSQQWLVESFSHLATFLCSHIASPPLPPPSAVKNPHDYIGLTQIIQASRPTARS